MKKMKMKRWVGAGVGVGGEKKKGWGRVKNIGELRDCVLCFLLGLVSGLVSSFCVVAVLCVVFLLLVLFILILLTLSGLMSSITPLHFTNTSYSIPTLHPLPPFPHPYNSSLPLPLPVLNPPSPPLPHPPYQPV